METYTETPVIGKDLSELGSEFEKYFFCSYFLKNSENFLSITQIFNKFGEFLNFYNFLAFSVKCFSDFFEIYNIFRIL